MTWAQSPWMARDFAYVGLVQFGDRATEFVTRADSPEVYLERALPQTAAELGGEWAALARRDHGWAYVASSSEAADTAPPAEELSECLDRDAAGFVPEIGRAHV